MPDDSESSYDAFVESIRTEWKKLCDATQDEMFEEFPGIEYVLGSF
jgi:hypothetical protein